jgi:hypothetical protein
MSTDLKTGSRFNRVLRSRPKPRSGAQIPLNTVIIFRRENCTFWSNYRGIFRNYRFPSGLFAPEGRGPPTESWNLKSVSPRAFRIYLFSNVRMVHQNPEVGINPYLIMVVRYPTRKTPRRVLRYTLSLIHLNDSGIWNLAQPRPDEASRRLPATQGGGGIAIHYSEYSL